MRGLKVGEYQNVSHVETTTQAQHNHVYPCADGFLSCQHRM
jgi:hypothetical protein